VKAFLRFYKPYTTILTLVIVCTFLTSAMDLVFPMAVRLYHAVLFCRQVI
jgi:ABC-type multidrug transport system fused ATPase/permease subunit